jgi:hypothetical protein
MQIERQRFVARRGTSQLRAIGRLVEGIRELDRRRVGRISRHLQSGVTADERDDLLGNMDFGASSFGGRPITRSGAGEPGVMRRVCRQLATCHEEAGVIRSGLRQDAMPEVEHMPCRARRVEHGRRSLANQLPRAEQDRRIEIALERQARQAPPRAVEVQAPVEADDVGADVAAAIDPPAGIPGVVDPRHHATGAGGGSLHALEDAPHVGQCERVEIRRGTAALPRCRKHRGVGAHSCAARYSPAVSAQMPSSSCASAGALKSSDLIALKDFDPPPSTRYVATVNGAPANPISGVRPASSCSRGWSGRSPAVTGRSGSVSAPARRVSPGAVVGAGGPVGDDLALLGSGTRMSEKNRSVHSRRRTVAA